MAKSKRRKKKKRNGLLTQMQRPVEEKQRLTVAHLLSENSDLSSEVRHRLQIVWDSLMCTPGADLIDEARGYGYPLKNLLDFYIAEHDEDSTDIDEQKNIKYLKSVETWDDFQPFIDVLREIDEPSDGFAPFVPPDMLWQVVDQRMRQVTKDIISQDVADMDEKTLFGYLVAESVRTLKGMSIDTYASLMEMPAEAYIEMINAMQTRAQQSGGVLDKVSLAVKFFELKDRQRRRPA